MNYWVLSPNVEQDPSVENQWKQAILKYQIAVMGWDVDNSIGARFVNEVKVGDIILIAQGANTNKRLFLCGEVSSLPLKDRLDEMPNSKYFVYLENCIDSKELISLNLSFEGAAYGDASRIPALYILKPWENKVDEEICIKLNNQIKRKKIQNIMNSMILSDEQKGQFKLLYEKFSKTYTEDQRNELRIQAQNLIESFSIYLDKIKNNTFTLDHYTNRQANETGLPGYYLCNFLERTTRDLFGSSKPAGSALSFGIKADIQADSFTINGIDPNNHNKSNRDLAEVEFEKYKDFFKSLVSENDIQLQMNLIESNAFITAKQILRKFLVLLKPYDFIYAYNDRLDDLDNYFFGEDKELTKIEKSHRINLVAKEILEIKTDDLSNQIILSRFLWRWANSQSLFSKANPNVILYGPPGTGKTYKVKQDLEFLTKGDASRVKYVVFHPSYGYEDFIEGIKPIGISAKGNMKFQLVNGAFKEFCIEAKKRPDEDFYFVVDEINRANLSAVFGETLVCLEGSYRDDPKDEFNNRHLFSTQYSSYQKQLEAEEKKKLAYEVSADGEVLFGVPKNVYFIGMMNNVDKNIDSFDLALRRRFKWIYFGCDYEVIETLKNSKGITFENTEAYANACRNLNEFISSNGGLGLGKSFEFGHALYMKISAIERKKAIQQKSLDQLFTEFLTPTLHEYLRAYYDEAEIEIKALESQSKFKL